MIKDNPPSLPKGEKQSIQIDGAMIESIAYSLSDRQVRQIEAAAFERGMAARQYEVDNAFLLVSESDYKWEMAEKENDELRAKLKALEEPQPIAWMTNESLDRLLSGRNDSRGTVPVHASRSNVAKVPLYTAAGAKHE